MKAISWLIKLSLGLVLIIAIVAGILIATFDANQYRDQITQLVKQQTGRELQIGELNLALFPRLGVNLQNAALSNAPGFGEQAFVEVEKVQLGIAIMPLFKQQLEVDTLSLHGLNLNLARNAQGLTNWDDLVKPTKQAPLENTEASDSSATINPLEKLAALRFGGIDIQQARVMWDDQQTQQKVQLHDLSLTTGEIGFGAFFPIHLSARTDITNPDITLQLQLAIEAKLEQDGRYVLRQLALDSQVSGADLPIEHLKTTLNLPTLDLALNEQRITLAQVELNYDVLGKADFPLAKLNGTIRLNDLVFQLAQQHLSFPQLQLNYQGSGQGAFPLQTFQGGLTLKQLNADLKQQQFNLTQATLNSQLQGETLPNGQVDLALGLVPSLDLKAQTATLNQVNLQALGVKLTGAAQLKTLLDNPQIAAQIAIAETNLRHQLEQLNIQLPQMQDATSLTRFATSMQLAFNSQTQALDVQKLSLNLDDSQLNGRASVKNFAAPDIRWDLTLNQINLNRYLPPKSDKTSQTEQPEPEADPQINLPVELLRKLTLNGQFKAGHIQFDKLEPKNLHLIIKGEPGYILVERLTTDLFNTQLNAQASVDVRSEQQQFMFKTNTRNLPIGEVLKTLADTDKLSGTGTVIADITTAGNRVSQFKQHLNGMVDINLKDGAVKGFNLAKSVRDAKAMFGGQAAAKTNEPLQTDFSSLIAKASIVNGIVSTQALSAQAPFMRIEGNGQVNLPQDSLDFLVRTSIVATAKGQGGDDLTDLNGLTIPVKLTGALNSPKVSLDLASLMEEKAKQEIQKQIDEQKAKLQQEVQKQIEAQKDEALKGIGEELKQNLFKGLSF
ncbi:MAG: AsmA family protein [Thiomicrospira sp.]